MTALMKPVATQIMLRSVQALSVFALVGCEPVPESGIDRSEGQIPVADADTAMTNHNHGHDDSMTNEAGVEGTSPENGDEPVDARHTEVAGEEVNSSEDMANATTSETGEVGPNPISNEQDFDAVSDRQTIESDASRLKAQREAYLEIRYSELPKRGDEPLPNIVEFALSTINTVGEQVWPRSGIFSKQRYQKNCASFANEDFAQEAFLANGGPRRNWNGLDPDGDGFACGWNPTRFRDSLAEGE